MKVSRNLLRQFIDFRGESSEALAPRIAEHCFEVESIAAYGSPQPAFTNVFAAKILSAEKHPNADRLRVVALELSAGKVVEPVVCGAWNFKAGDMVALALPGARIPQDVHSEKHESFMLGSAKIRGVESQGMICSAFELGLRLTPEEKLEIMILPTSVVAGTDLKKYFSSQSFTDEIIEFSLPANRPDLHSHLGIAAEFAGMLGMKPTALFKQMQKDYAAPKLPKAASKAKGLAVETAIRSPKCLGFCAARLSVKIGAASESLRRPLAALGHGGINNVVDITNYVMHEVGQPLHAYDAARVEGAIVAREAKAGETILALDGKTYELPQGALVIADDRKILGIAGIIGGMDGKVTDETTEIILEAGMFDAFAVRKTAKAIGLRTDAAALFEKGLSARQAEFGFVRAIELLKRDAAAVVLSAPAIKLPAAGLKAAKPISITAESINGILGTTFTITKIKSVLSGLGFAMSGAKQLNVTPPHYRKDIEDAAGIADELARFTGMNLIARQPLEIARTAPQRNAAALIWQAKDAMVGLGYFEVQTYSFLSAEDIAAIGSETYRHVRVSNPLSSETEFLRTDLAAGLLRAAGSNAKHESNVQLFEAGFGYDGYGMEKPLLGFVIYKRGLSAETLVAQAKGNVLQLLGSLGVDAEIHFNQTSGTACEIVSGGATLGAIQVITASSKSAKRYGLEAQETVLCQLQLDAVTPLVVQKGFTPFSRFPVSSFDLSIVVAEATPWKGIEDIVHSAAGDDLRELTVLDAPYLHAKNALPQFHKTLAKEGKKNVVFSVVLGSSEGTLQDSKISAIYAKMREELQKKLNAEIR